MVSFPRDLWLPLSTGHGAGRINAAYGQGRQVLIDTIAQNFGITINHYVEIDFTGFQRLVERHRRRPRLPRRHLPRPRSRASARSARAASRSTASSALAFARSRHLERRDERRRLGHRPHRRPRAHHPPAVPHPRGPRAGARDEPVHQPADASPTCSTSPSTRWASTTACPTTTCATWPRSSAASTPRRSSTTPLPDAGLPHQRRRRRAPARRRRRADLQHLPRPRPRRGRCPSRSTVDVQNGTGAERQARRHRRGPDRRRLRDARSTATPIPTAATDRRLRAPAPRTPRSSWPATSRRRPPSCSTTIARRSTRSRS